jgi:hypothetical protein
MMNAQNVLKVHGEVFYGALLLGDLDTLATLYSDEVDFDLSFIA